VSDLQTLLIEASSKAAENTKRLHREQAQLPPRHRLECWSVVELEN
jgi:hypothetical protein